MAYTYNVNSLTNLGQLKKLAQRTKTELDLIDARVDTLENAGYIPESAIDEKISAAVAGALVPGGSVAFASLPTAAKANVNKIYNITDGFTTTASFVEGAGHTYPAGTNVAIINVGTEGSPVYKYDTYTGTFDFSGFATKVTGATAGHFAALDANGNLTDSGKKPADFLTEHQDISGKADKDTDATAGNIAEFDSNGNPVDSGRTFDEFLTEHQDITGKADKAVPAAAGNFAALDVNGNLADSGKKAADFIPVIASPTTNNFVKQNASGQVVDAGYGLASDTDVDNMIHDVWGDTQS